MSQVRRRLLLGSSVATQMGVLAWEEGRIGAADDSGEGQQPVAE
jgi:hypothetical protein